MQHSVKTLRAMFERTNNNTAVTTQDIESTPLISATTLKPSVTNAEEKSTDSSEASTPVVSRSASHSTLIRKSSLAQLSTKELPTVQSRALAFSQSKTALNIRSGVNTYVVQPAAELRNRASGFVIGCGVSVYNTPLNFIYKPYRCAADRAAKEIVAHNGCSAELIVSIPAGIVKGLVSGAYDTVTGPFATASEWAKLAREKHNTPKV